jgi:hypothetical protein
VEAVAEAEKLIAGAAHVRTEQDLIEGYDYLAGSVRASLQLAWAYERDFPYFVQSTGPYTKMGLDNPDTLYFHCYLRDDAEYIVSGRRGTTTDLSFQILNGDYSPVDVPDSLAAFDDRGFDIDPSDGTFEIRFGGSNPSSRSSRSSPSNLSNPSNRRRNHFPLARGSAMLVVREVFSDWTAEQRGTIRIRRAGNEGEAPPPLTQERIAKRYGVAGKILLSRLRTFLAFPEWFYLKLPVNTLTEPRLTPGGLASQYSSVGHYDLDPGQAMIVTVPAAKDVPYQGIQLGSMWYISLDYINHQTSLTAAQAHIDPDGMMRFVISERDPGHPNWLETLGHRRGYVQLRWQRLSRTLTKQDGPEVEIMPIEKAPKLEHDYRARIAARQAAVAQRMLG